MPVTGRPIALVTAIAILAAGCGSDGPTLNPRTAPPATASTAPTATATATGTLQPTVGVTPQPTVDCSIAGAEPGLGLPTAVGFETIDLQEGPLESPIVVDASDMPIVGTIVGGIQVMADLAVGDGLEASTEISTITADFVPFGTTSTLPVAATPSGSSASLRLPDKRVDGQLRVALSWTTECGSGTGTGTIALTVVPSSVMAGCPSTPDHLADALAPLKNAKVTIGTAVEPLTVVGWAGRWILGNGATDAPQFAGWDDAHPVVAAPEAPIVVRESVNDLAMVLIQGSIYRRADVVAYLAGGSTDELATFIFLRRNANSKGRASLPAPLDPGTYVMELTGSWLTSCLSVETYTVVSIEVR